MFFAIGLFSFSAFQLLLRAFYAMQDTRTPALINVAAVALNVVVNFPLFHAMGVKGLALGNTIAYTFAALVAAGILRRRMGGLDGTTIVRGLGLVAVASAATGAAAYVVSHVVGHSVSVNAVPLPDAP